MIFELLLVIEPVAHHFCAIGSKDALGVELDAADVHLLVAQCHDLTFGACGRHLKTVWEPFCADDPRVVSTDRHLGREPLEDVVGGLRDDGGRLNAMEYIAQVDELAAEDLSDGLMTEAYAKDWLPTGIVSDDIEKETRLAWDAWAWGEDYAIVFLKVGELELVISDDIDGGSELLDEV